MEKYSANVHTQMQGCSASRSACVDSFKTFAHAASFAACAFFFAIAGDAVVTSSFAAIILPIISIILSIICIIIEIAIMRHNTALRRQQ